MTDSELLLAELKLVYNAWREEGLGWVDGLEQTNWPDAWKHIGVMLNGEDDA